LHQSHSKRKHYTSDSSALKDAAQHCIFTSSYLGENRVIYSVIEFYRKLIFYIVLTNN